MARHKEFDPSQALDAAVDVFWEQGYAATSVEHLTDRLGISRRSLYDTFGSKHALYVRAVDRYVEQETARLLAPLGTGAPVREALRAVLERVRDGVLSDPRSRGCLLVNAAMECAPDDEVVMTRVAAAFDGMREAIRDAVRAGQASGEIGPDVPAEDTAVFLVTVVQGMRVMGKAAPDPSGLEATIRLAVGRV